jgi:hypothetical protein
VAKHTVDEPAKTEHGPSVVTTDLLTWDVIMRVHEP